MEELIKEMLAEDGKGIVIHKPRKNGQTAFWQSTVAPNTRERTIVMDTFHTMSWESFKEYMKERGYKYIHDPFCDQHVFRDRERDMYHAFTGEYVRELHFKDCTSTAKWKMPVTKMIVDEGIKVMNTTEPKVRMQCFFYTDFGWSISCAKDEPELDIFVEDVHPLPYSQFQQFTL